MGLGQRTRDALVRAAARTAAADARAGHTTRDSLHAWAAAALPALRVVIASNREPYSHVERDGAIHWTRNAGGLTVALDAVMQALGGSWVAHGSGPADARVVDAHDRVRCPPDAPRYDLRRIWLTAEDHELYYSGFANGGLWPLCHIAYVRPRFRREEWERYRDVNRRFAEAILEEVGSQPALVVLQDYHLALVARHLREARPDLALALFWHIPWPNSEVIRRLPWREEVLDGMLANDLVGFHIRYHAQNFLETVADAVEARVDHEHLAVVRGGRRTRIQHFPIGADADGIAELAASPATAQEIPRIREAMRLGDAVIGLGVDRMDYTKGIPERLDAVQRFYEKHPEWVGRFRFIQVGVPSRIELAEYRDVALRTRERAAAINQRFAPEGPPLVHLIEENLDFRQLVPLYAMADLCAVTSLHDGMNLVAKEYVASCVDDEGALVLSPFTGAARDLVDAWIASPFDVEGMADAFHAALVEAPDRRRERMRGLHEAVLGRNVFDWAKSLLTAAHQAGRAARARRRARTPAAGARPPRPARGAAR